MSNVLTKELLKHTAFPAFRETLQIHSGSCSERRDKILLMVGLLGFHRQAVPQVRPTQVRVSMSLTRTTRYLLFWLLEHTSQGLGLYLTASNRGLQQGSEGCHFRHPTRKHSACAWRRTTPYSPCRRMGLPRCVISRSDILHRVRTHRKGCQNTPTINTTQQRQLPYPYSGARGGRSRLFFQTLVRR
jgi:hypothetical protein